MIIKKIFYLVLIFSCLLLVGCLNQPNQSPRQLVTTTSIATPLPSPTTRISKAIYKIGDEVDFGGIIMRVVRVDTNYTDVTIEYDAKKQHLIAVELAFKVTNSPVAEPFDFVSSDVELYTALSTSITPLLEQGKKPLLSSQKMAKNSTEQGWVTFIVDRNQTIEQIAYKPKFFGPDMRVVIGLK